MLFLFVYIPAQCKECIIRKKKFILFLSPEHVIVLHYTIYIFLLYDAGFAWDFFFKTSGYIFPTTHALLCRSVKNEHFFIFSNRVFLARPPATLSQQSEHSWAAVPHWQFKIRPTRLAQPSSYFPMLGAKNIMKRGVFIRFSLTNLMCVQITGLNKSDLQLLVWVANTECSGTALKLKHREVLTRYYHCSFDCRWAK